MRMFQHQNMKAIQNRFEEKTGVSLSESTVLVERKPAVRRRPLLAVAVFVLIAASLTGVAAIAGNQKEKSPPAWGDAVVGETDENGFSVSGNLYTFYLDIALEQDAPAEVEDFYLPQVPASYPQFMGALYDGLDHGPIGVTTFAWETEGDRSGIMFYQYSDLYDDHIRDGMISVPMGIMTDGAEPTVTETTYGDVKGFLIPEPLHNNTYFVWGDGQYAYTLCVPHDFTDGQLHELVRSVRRVEDVRPYLISMTEEKIEAALDKKGK